MHFTFILAVALSLTSEQPTEVPITKVICAASTACDEIIDAPDWHWIHSMPQVQILTRKDNSAVENSKRNNLPLIYTWL